MSKDDRIIWALENGIEKHGNLGALLCNNTLAREFYSELSEAAQHTLAERQACTCAQPWYWFEYPEICEQCGQLITPAPKA